MMLRHFKGEPNTHVIRFRGGNVLAHGPGLQFWYLPYNTTVATVPTASRESQFIFTETTTDFQEISIQGSLMYRLTRPLELAERFDFTLDPRTLAYRTDDPEKLLQRVVNSIQAQTRRQVQALSLEEALAEAKDLSSAVFEAVRSEPELEELGVVIEHLHFAEVNATRETQKALEADYRESLQRRADQAIYARRAAAVEEERNIREREMNTDVELENRRQELVDMQARNQLALAESEAKAEEMKLEPYGALPPQALVGLALKEFAANPGKISNLTITPDLLSKVVHWAVDERGSQ